MLRLSQARAAWGTPDFEGALKGELERLDAGTLPLQQGLCHTSYVASSPHRIRILSITDDPNSIMVRVGIFYAGIIAGCSCADDPTPTEEQPEYCEVQLEIGKATAETRIRLLS